MRNSRILKIDEEESCQSSSIHRGKPSGPFVRLLLETNFSRCRSPVKAICNCGFDLSTEYRIGKAPRTCASIIRRIVWLRFISRTTWLPLPVISMPVRSPDTARLPMMVISVSDTITSTNVKPWLLQAATRAFRQHSAAEGGIAIVLAQRIGLLLKGYG